MERKKNDHQRQAFLNLLNDVGHAKDDVARSAALNKVRKIHGDSVDVSVIISLAHAHAISKREKYLETNTREAKREMQLAAAVAAYAGLNNNKVCNPYRDNKTSDSQTFILDSIQSIYTIASDEKKTLLDEHYRELYGKTCPELIAQISIPSAERHHLTPIDAKKVQIATIGTVAIGAGLLSVAPPAIAAPVLTTPTEISVHTIRYSDNDIYNIPASFTPEVFGLVSTDGSDEIILDPVAPPKNSQESQDSGEIELDPVAPPSGSVPPTPPQEQPQEQPPVSPQPSKPPVIIPPKPARPPVTKPQPDVSKPDKKPEKEQEIKVTGWGQGAGNGHELTYYNQWEEPWASYDYHYQGGSGDVNKCGCGPTSFASIVATMTGKDVTPKDTAKFFMEHGAHSSAGYCGSNHIWEDGTSSQKALEKEYGVEIHRIAISDKAFKEAIDAGGMVYMSQGQGMFTSGGHIMAVSGYNNLKNKDGGNHKYIVSDSNSRTKTNDLEGYSPSVLIGNGQPDTKAGLGGKGGTRGYVKGAWAVIPTKKTQHTSNDTPKESPKDTPKEAPNPKSNAPKAEPKLEMPKEIPLNPIPEDEGPDELDLNPVAPSETTEPEAPEITELAPQPTTPETITPTNNTDVPQIFVNGETIVLRNKFNANHIITDIPTLTKQQMRHATLHKVSQ